MAKYIRVVPLRAHWGVFAARVIQLPIAACDQVNGPDTRGGLLQADTEILDRSWQDIAGSAHPRFRSSCGAWAAVARARAPGRLRSTVPRPNPTPNMTTSWIGSLRCLRLQCSVARQCEPVLRPQRSATSGPITFIGLTAVGCFPWLRSGACRRRSRPPEVPTSTVALPMNTCRKAVWNFTWLRSNIERDKTS
jgi:hypothetical protein